jgi:hypothetical protein
MNAFDALCQSVLIVLFNATWQVAVVGLLAFGALRLGRVESPPWRYGICVGALLAITVCPMLRQSCTPRTPVGLPSPPD